MKFVTEGFPLILGSVAVSALVFLVALRLRSWPMWLGGLACSVAAVAVAWYFRAPLPSA